MPKPPSSQPTEVELRILKILWQSGPCTARQIHNGLAVDKETNYSTTVKMLAVMFDKSMVTRDESTFPITFGAAASQTDTRKSVLADVVRKLYDGSAKSLILQLLSSSGSSKADLDEIRTLIDELDSRRAETNPQKKKNVR